MQSWARAMKPRPRQKYWGAQQDRKPLLFLAALYDRRMLSLQAMNPIGQAYQPDIRKAGGQHRHSNRPRLVAQPPNVAGCFEGRAPLLLHRQHLVGRAGKGAAHATASVRVVWWARERSATAQAW